MQLPLAYIDATVVEEVPVGLWRELFDSIGWPASLDGARANLDHSKVLAALQQDEGSDELFQALEALDVLGTEAGEEEIVSAMQDQHVATDVLPEGAGARELALRLFLVQRNDPSLASVLIRAQTAAQIRSQARRYHEFLGSDARVVSGLEACRAALETAVRQYASEQDLGDHVDVRCFEQDGAVTFHVIRSHRTQKPLAVVPGRAARAMIAYRPVHSDLLRYETATGRLRIAARAASVVQFFRRTMGDVLFQDPSFFSADSGCSLKPLQERGRQAFDRHELPEIGRVWLTECLWERGDRGLVHLRSNDCFREIDELRLPLAEGELLQAKLKVQVMGPSARPVTVTIRLPSRIDISQKRHEAVIERFLSAVGIRERRSGSRDVDLWSLYPWRHGLSVWRSLFGRDTDHLIELGVLDRVRLDTVPSAEQATAGHALTAVELPGGEIYGVSRTPDVPSRSLTATDLDGWMLDPEALRQELRSRLNIVGTARPWAPGDRLLDLGAVELGDTKIHLAYAIRQPQPGTGEALRRLASGPYALLVASPSYRNDDLPIVLLSNPLPSRQETIRSAIAAAGVSDHVDALTLAGDAARLVVDTRLERIWVDGVAITSLTPGSQPFRFVVRLAQSQAPVSLSELTALLSGARQDGTVAARQAKRDAKKAIAASLDQAGRSLDEDPFPTCGTGAYRCALPRFVR